MHLPSCHRSNRSAKKPRGTFRQKKNYPFFGACSLLRGIGEPSSHYQRKRLVIPVGPLDCWKTVAFEAARRHANHFTNHDSNSHKDRISAAKIFLSAVVIIQKRNVAQTIGSFASIIQRAKLLPAVDVPTLPAESSLISLYGGSHFHLKSAVF